MSCGGAGAVKRAGLKTEKTLGFQGFRQSQKTCSLVLTKVRILLPAFFVLAGFERTRRQEVRGGFNFRED